MQPLHHAHLQVKANLTALDQVLEWFDHQAKRDSVPEIVWMKCKLALAEGFTSAVRHNYQGETAALIDIEIAIFSEWLEIRVWDSGSPFNLHLELREKLLQPLHRAHLQAKTDLTALDQVLEWFDDQTKRDPVPEIVWMKCKLAFAEGFTNAVRHAHQGESTALIDMEIAIFSEWLEIRVWDFGSPFDIYLELREKLLKGLLARRDSDEFDLSEGGRGIKLMWKIADLLQYKRTLNDGNCLLILKHYTLDP